MKCLQSIFFELKCYCFLHSGLNFIEKYFFESRPRTSGAPRNMSAKKSAACRKRSRKKSVGNSISKNMRSKRRKLSFRCLPIGYMANPSNRKRPPLRLTMRRMMMEVAELPIHYLLYEHIFVIIISIDNMIDNIFVITYFCHYYIFAIDNIPVPCI